MDVNQALAVVIRETIPARVKTKLNRLKELEKLLAKSGKMFCQECQVLDDQICDNCEKHLCDYWRCENCCSHQCSACDEKWVCAVCEDAFCSDHARKTSCGCTLCDWCQSSCELCSEHQCDGQHLIKCEKCKGNVCQDCRAGDRCRVCGTCGYCKQSLSGAQTECLNCDKAIHTDCWKDQIQLPMCRKCLKKCQLK